MNILISNDDGVYAPGIKTLADHLAKQGYHVYVGAPDRERSTTGHCLTLHKPLRALEVTDVFDHQVTKAWKINGTPCDATKLALNILLGRDKVDMLISGINRGPNLGTDVIYSGTVSAAMEGAIVGIPSIAVSLASFDDLHYHTAALFIGQLLEQMKHHHLPRHTVLNVNVPPIEPEEVKGVQVTKLGLHRFRDVFEKRTDLRHQDYYWQTGIVEDHEEEEGTDVLAIQHGYVSVTPIHYDMTRYGLLDELKQWNLKLKSGSQVV